MKKRLLGGVLFALLLGATTGCSQDAPNKQNGTSTSETPAAPAQGSDAAITPELIRLAEFAKMDYKATLAKCKKGDQQAIMEFFDFYRIVENKSAIEHSLVCLDMIATSGDGNVAEVCKGLKEKLKVMVREQLVAAQPKSANPALQKSMSEWAPKTWAALNNQVLSDPARDAAKSAEKEAKRKEGAGAKEAGGVNAGGEAPTQLIVPAKGGG